MTDKCFYCKKNEAISEYAYSHKMYFVHKRTKLWLGFQYSEKEIKIPRCKECYDKHMNFAPILTYGGLLFFLSLWLWLFREMVNESLWTYLLGVLVMTFFTYGPLFYVYRLIFFSKHLGIPDEEEFDGFPMAEQLLKDGWVKSRPDPASHPNTGHENITKNLVSEKIKDE